jgi:hypothetical protein
LYVAPQTKNPQRESDSQMKYTRIKRVGGLLAILAGMFAGINAIAQVVSYPGSACYANDGSTGVCYCYGIPACGDGDPNMTCDWFGTKINVWCVCSTGHSGNAAFDECGTTLH